MAVEPGVRGVTSVGALIVGVVGVLALTVAAFAAGHSVGQGDTAELERRLKLCNEEREALTERLSELDEPRVTEVQEQQRPPEPSTDEPATVTTAFELEMTPGQAVELLGTGVWVRVADIRAKNGGRGVVLIIKQAELEYSTFLASGEQAEVGGWFVRVKEIQPGRVKLYIEL
jgi:hypothetical protein